jgi:hypothetical protein
MEAGYRYAFLTHIDFAPNHADVFYLPRITIPDDNIDINLFRALVLGGQIPFQRIKRTIYDKLSQLERWRWFRRPSQ